MKKQKSNKYAIDKIMNVKGLACPAPTVMTAKALEEMQKGSVLKIISNDRTTKKTIPELCSREHYSLIETDESNGVLYFIVKK